MTAQGREVAASWQDAEFARAWTAADGQEGLLQLPRAIAPAVVREVSGEADLVIDIASGPGDFLAAFLDEFPRARGVWSDASEDMRRQAEERLARFGDRVTFVMADMTSLGEAGLPDNADVVMTSRATHHLDVGTLSAYYAEAANLLRTGWLVNLDHVGLEQPWHDRMRVVRKRFVPSKGGTDLAHFHVGDPPSIQDHVEALAAAGVEDPEICWRAFRTCLFMGQSGT